MVDWPFFGKTKFYIFCPSSPPTRSKNVSAELTKLALHLFYLVRLD